MKKKNNLIKSSYIFLFRIKYLMIKLIINYFIVFNILNSYNSYKLFLNLKKKYYGTYSITINNKTYTYLRNNIIKKYNLYINYCLKNIKKKFNYPLLHNPKISVIIPLFNGGKYLKYSLSSVQNQKMKAIEIILVDDCSEDNTLNIINKYMQQDKRIRLIKNMENRKILYSKSIAALNANGKYIIQLDQDDMFIRDDIFNILYYEAEIYNLDLVQIRDLTLNNYHINNNIRVNYKRRHFIFKKNAYNISHFEDLHSLKKTLFKGGTVYPLWGMIIKSDLYKKSIYYLWPLIMNYQIIYYEDYIMTLIIIVLSKKYKYLNIFALIHISNMNTSFKKYRKEFIHSVLFFGNNIYYYYIKNNPQDINIAINFVKRYRNVLKNSYKKYYNFFSFNIRNIINNQYISNKDKYHIIKELEIKDDDYRKWNSYKYLMNSTEYDSIYNFQKKNIENPIKRISKIFNPKITIIILFFEIQCLKKTINSILNQDYISTEIILINGNDTNNNLNPIKKYIRKYKNIKLLNNKKEKGILYLYSKGVFASKGDFILILKSGQTMAKANILSYVYNKTINNNIDVLEFDLLVNNNKDLKTNSLRKYKCKHIKSEIIIPSLKYNKKYREIDQEKEILNNKLIKIKFLKYIINNYKLNKYDLLIYNYYDEILLFLIFKEVKKFVRINVFGVILWINNIENNYETNINNNNQKINDSIFYINFLFDNSKNEFEAKQLVLYKYYNILSTIYNTFIGISEKSKKLYKKFFNCIYITEFEKKKLTFLIKSLLN